MARFAFVAPMLKMTGPYLEAFLCTTSGCRENNCLRGTAGSACCCIILQRTEEFKWRSISSLRKDKGFHIRMWMLTDTCCALKGWHGHLQIRIPASSTGCSLLNSIWTCIAAQNIGTFQVGKTSENVLPDFFRHFFSCGTNTSLMSRKLAQFSCDDNDDHVGTGTSQRGKGVAEMTRYREYLQEKWTTAGTTLNVFAHGAAERAEFLFRLMLGD